MVTASKPGSAPTGTTTKAGPSNERMDTENKMARSYIYLYL